MSDPTRCDVCGRKKGIRGPVECEGAKVAESCLRIGYEKARASLTTAEKALRELLRLYDWRFELAHREGLAERHAMSEDFQAETRRLLRQYGAEKKAAWSAARTALSGGTAGDAP